MQSLSVDNLKLEGGWSARLRRVVGWLGMSPVRRVDDGFQSRRDETRLPKFGLLRECSRRIELVVTGGWVASVVEGSRRAKVHQARVHCDVHWIQQVTSHR